MADEIKNEGDLTTESTDDLQDTAIDLPENYQESAQFKGLVADKTEETHRRQAAEADATRLRDENTRLSQQASLGTKDTSATDDGDVGDDDDLLTVGQFKAYRAKEAQQAKAQQAETERRSQADTFERAQPGARAKHTVTTEGEGLDYDTVVYGDEGTKRILQQNPDYMAAIIKAANPAEEAYKIGLTDPTVAARVQAKRDRQTVEKIAQNKTGPQAGGGSSPAAHSFSELDKLSTLSDADLEAQTVAAERAEGSY